MQTIKINISDVVMSDNSVTSAIHAYAKESDAIASGVVGQSFATSGPGAGWSKQYDESDYAQRALGDSDDGGARYYLDADDGRVAELDASGDVVWSDESMICLVCPDTDDATEYPDALRAMAAALSTHADHSPMSEWRALAKSLRAATDALECISTED